VGVGEPPYYAHYLEIHALQEKIEAHLGRDPYGDVPWFRMREGDTFEVPDVGLFEVVEVHDQLDDYSDWSQPIYVILCHLSQNRFYRVTGKNKSHIGNEWNYASMVEVTGTRVTRVSWQTVEPE
jgi:hypothetical protein